MLDYSNLGLDSNLQKIDGIASQERDWTSEYMQDASMEKGAFVPPTQIQKGTTSITGVSMLNGLPLLGGTERLKEAIYPIVDPGASGGGGDSFYTDGTAWQSLNQARVTLSSNTYPGCDLYLECVYRCGTAGAPGYTFYSRLYNVTDGTPAPNGTVSGTTQSLGTITNPGAFPLVRGATPITFGTATKDYIIQYCSSGTYYVDLYQGRLIIKY